MIRIPVQRGEVFQHQVINASAFLGEGETFPQLLVDQQNLKAWTKTRQAGLKDQFIGGQEAGT